MQVDQARQGYEVAGVKHRDACVVRNISTAIVSLLYRRDRSAFDQDVRPVAAERPGSPDQPARGFAASVRRGHLAPDPAADFAAAAAATTGAPPWSRDPPSSR